MLEAQALSIHVASAQSLFDRPDFLASLEGQTDPAYQVVYVDLGSGDARTTSEFDLTRPDVVRLRTFRNLGVVRGHNQAIAMALRRWTRSDWVNRYVVLTRPEVAFDRGFCEAVQRAFAKDPSLMIAGPKMFRAESAPQPDGDWVEMIYTEQLYAAGVGITPGRALVFLGEGSQDAGRFDHPERLVGFSDVCLIIRASFFETLAMGERTWLDPRLPPFFSTLDACWRGAQVGVLPRLLPEARIWFAPEDRTRTFRSAWRERYVPSDMRKGLDDLALRLVHVPWLLPSYVRYRLSRMIRGRYWEERLRVEGDASSLAALKTWRRPDRAVPFNERRRWFLP